MLSKNPSLSFCLFLKASFLISDFKFHVNLYIYILLLVRFKNPKFKIQSSTFKNPKFTFSTFQVSALIHVYRLHCGLLAGSCARYALRDAHKVDQPTHSCSTARHTRVAATARDMPRGIPSLTMRRKAFHSIARGRRRWGRWLQIWVLPLQGRVAIEANHVIFSPADRAALTFHPHSV